MTTTNIAEGTEVAELNEDGAIGVLPKSHAGLEQHVRPGLSGELPFILGIAWLPECGQQACLVIRREQDNDCGSLPKGNLQNLTYVR